MEGQALRPFAKGAAIANGATIAKVVAQALGRMVHDSKTQATSWTFPHLEIIRGTTSACCLQEVNGSNISSMFVSLLTFQPEISLSNWELINIASSTIHI